MRIIGVAWAGDQSSYGDFIDRHNLSFPNIDDTAGEVYLRYSVAAQPAWVFIRDRKHVTMRGMLTEDQVRAAIEGT